MGRVDRPPAEVIVLGVDHAAQLVNPRQQPAALRAFFSEVRPAVICIERSPERFARGDHYEFTYEIQGQDKDQSGIRRFGSLLAEVMPKVLVGGECILANSDLDGEDTDSYVWFGARFAPRENVSVQADVLNNANVGGNDRSDYVFHAGAQYAFSFAK